MDELLHLLSRYGYTILFFNLFLESIGLPIPAGPMLVAAGAASAFGTLQLWLVVVISLSGMILGDWLLYMAGRYSGWALLGFLCRLSVNPESCILNSAQLFYKRGRVTLLFSKFVPGINTMTAPMAGSLNMRSSQFLGLDLLGTMLYTFPFIAFGYFFRHLVSVIADRLYSLSLGLEFLALVALVAYLIYRFRNYWKNRLYRAVPQVTVDVLAERLSSKEAGEKALIVDTRSHGYYDPGAMRIQGSIRIEPNNLLAEMEKLPKDKEIYVYCTWVRELTSARVVHLLRQNGYNAYVVKGGYRAWRRSGREVEPVPLVDIVKLPKFNTWQMRSKMIPLATYVASRGLAKRSRTRGKRGQRHF